MRQRSSTPTTAFSLDMGQGSAWGGAGVHGPKDARSPWQAGVKDMILHCAEYMSDSEVSGLVNSINLKLGMTQAGK